MPTFIKLTTEENEPAYVAIDKIVPIEALKGNGNRTMIYYGENHYDKVLEDPEQILKLIEEANKCTSE